MRIVVALGGNALLQHGESADADIQESHVNSAVGALTPLARRHQRLASRAGIRGQRGVARVAVRLTKRRAHSVSATQEHELLFPDFGLDLRLAAALQRAVVVGVQSPGPPHGNP